MNAIEQTLKTEVVEYLPEHRQRFKEINVQWITRKYVMEEEDIKTVEDPEGYVLKGGGKIFIAMYDNYAVGTVAYLNMGNNVFEMIKLAVDEDYRGLKIGKILCEQSIESMKQYGAKKIILFSNTQGSAEAINLYRKLGFIEVPLGTSEFQRADIKMEITLCK